MKAFPLFSLLLMALFTAACGGQNTAPAPEPSKTTTVVQTSAVQDLSPEEFADRIGAPNTVVLDVRTPGETAGGVIPGAIELDFRSPDFAAQISQLDKDKTYLVYCAAGGRSSKACGMMEEAGFREVYNLTGGYRAWKE